jgi:flagellar hook-length control protein FliK
VTAADLTPVDTATQIKATASVTPKTDQAKSQAGSTEGSATSSSADATSDTTQNVAPSLSPTTGKAEAANAVAQGTPADATAQAPAAAARDRAASVTHAAATDLTDTNSQAIGPLQFNSTAPLTSTSNLTVTAAANGTVPLSGVAVEIAANVKSGKSSFEIRLDPADLGRIDVHVQIDQNGQVTSHLTVEKPETLSLLRQDAPQLQQALSDAGLKTDSGGLQFSLRDQSSSGQNGGNGSNPNAHRLIISDEDAIPAAVAGRSYGRSLASSGGVDIRV